MKNSWTINSVRPPVIAEQYLEFCLAHGVSPHRSRTDILNLLSSHIHPEEPLIELLLNGERQAVAILDDCGSNAVRSRNLIMVGGLPLAKDGVTLILNEASQIARKKNDRFLDIFWFEGHPIAKQILLDLGFESVRKTTEILMTLEHSKTFLAESSAAVPTHLKWIDFETQYLDQLYDVYLRAFSKDASFPAQDKQSFYAMVTGLNIPTRLLVDQFKSEMGEKAQIVGFTICTLEEGKIGLLLEMGRDPEYPRAGIGALLFYESVRIMFDAGAQSFMAYVDVENKKPFLLWKGFPGGLRDYETLRLAL